MIIEGLLGEIIYYTRIYIISVLTRTAVTYEHTRSCNIQEEVVTYEAVWPTGKL